MNNFHPAEGEVPRAPGLGLRLPGRFNALLLTATLALSTQAAKAEAATEPVTAGQLDTYITDGAKAWQPYLAEDGHLTDPLEPANPGDGYGVGVIMLADTMLQTAARDGDESLVQTAEHIIGETASRSEVGGTFNLLAIETLLRHGQAGDFPAQAWDQVKDQVVALAKNVGSTIDEHGCLDDPECFSNWRIVWSVGATALLISGVQANPGTGLENPQIVAAQINSDLKMAVKYAGIPAETSIAGGQVRELSDQPAEPPSYHVFSTALLEQVAEQDPQAITPAVAKLRAAADRYSLDMMAPDGQMSLAGRSLDQSWVQAAAADLGARRAEQDPTHAEQWRSFANRALAYLMNNYPARPDGIVPIVPGLADRWDQDIMDSYAHQTQYSGLTLWFLNDALAHWPTAESASSTIPADHDMLVNDLRSSGLVWGSDGHTWWEVSGRGTSPDRRFDQGLVDVKVNQDGKWRDLLALRPIKSNLSSIWSLRLPDSETAAPVFDHVRGNGHHVSLTGEYKTARGRILAPVRWLLTTTKQGTTLEMSKPPKSSLNTTIWQPEQSAGLSGKAATAQKQTGTVTASGQAFPTTLRWTNGANAELKISG